jgi:hypothetical protein
MCQAGHLTQASPHAAAVEERPVTRAGTLDYMAPEVLACPDKRRPDENKDKAGLGYGLGVGG